MIRAGVTLAAALWSALPALANEPEFCDALNVLQIAAADPDASVTMVFPDAAQAEVPCSSALELGGIRSLSCNWSFPYRAPEAQTAFDTLNAAITACVGDAVAQDAPVNHPDTYDLLGYDGGISAALKDKATLGQTLVILRVQG